MTFTSMHYIKHIKMYYYAACSNKQKPKTLKGLFKWMEMNRKKDR